MRPLFLFIFLLSAVIVHNINAQEEDPTSEESQNRPAENEPEESVGPTTEPVSGGEDPTQTTEAPNTASTKRSVKDSLKKIRKDVQAKAKKIYDDVSNFDLSKLNVRNISQFLPFYNAYQKYFNKKYKNKVETDQRTDFLKRSIEAIKRHNARVKAKYQQGINELSDMNFAEVVKSKLGLKQETGDKVLKGRTAAAPVEPVEDLPEEWDWRNYGVVTEPRNQGKCGSCWSFAAATVLESHNMKRQIAEGKFDPKKQITVSEQNLIDCSEDFGTIGCEGGMPQQAFKYVHANRGIMGIDTYPYKGEKDDCRYAASQRVDVMVKEGRRLRTGQDKDLATAIYNYGPVAIALHVTKDMTAYKSGIFDDPRCDSKKVNHAVVIIGYAKDYFIVRNSWGPKWGEGGYIRISRSKENNCGVSQQGYYPLIPEAVDTKEMRDKLIVVTD